MYLHDPKHLAINYLKLYGREQFRPEPGASSFLEIEPTQVIHVNQESDPCITEKDNLRNMWDCITDHVYQDINCSLPWSSKKVAPLCSSPEEYDTYHTRSMDILSFDTDQIERTIHCTPACNRIEYSSKLFSTIKDPILTDKMIINLYFAKDKFPVKEQYYIYDGAVFIADFGSYLGLLLGYSLLAFYDILRRLIKTIFENCNRRLSREEKKGICVQK